MGNCRSADSTTPTLGLPRSLPALTKLSSSPLQEQDRDGSNRGLMTVKEGHDPNGNIINDEMIQQDGAVATTEAATTTSTPALSTPIKTTLTHVIQSSPVSSLGSPISPLMGSSSSPGTPLLVDDEPPSVLEVIDNGYDGPTKTTITATTKPIEYEAPRPELNDDDNDDDDSAPTMIEIPTCVGRENGMDDQQQRQHEPNTGDKPDTNPYPIDDDSNDPNNVDQSENEQQQSESVVVSAMDEFIYQHGVCAMNFWTPIRQLGEGCMSSIYLVQRRQKRLPHSVSYTERVDIMHLVEGSPRNHSTNQTQTASSVDETKANGPLYSLKAIMKAHVRNDYCLEEMRKEIHVMSHWQHPHIVRLYEVYESQHHIDLILEYCSGGDLMELPRVYEPQASLIVQQILSAVAYLHQHQIIHNELKMENIMLSSRGPDAHVKLIDFGLSKQDRGIHGNNRSMVADCAVGTLYCMAPQALQDVIDPKSDLWSIGVIAYMLLHPHKQPPFCGISPRNIISWDHRMRIMVDRIMRCHYTSMKGPSWRMVSQPAKDFVASLLLMNPQKRPTAEQALMSKWLLMHKFSGISLAPSRHDAVVMEEIILMKQCARSLLAERLSDDNLVSLSAALEAFDEGLQGRIQLKDFFAALAFMDCLSGTDIDNLSRLAADHDTASNYSMDYIQFIHGVVQHRQRRDSQRLIDDLVALDADQTGRIRKQDLVPILRKGHVPSTITIETILNKIDSNKGIINEDDDHVSIDQVVRLIHDMVLERVDAILTHRDASINNNNGSNGNEDDFESATEEDDEDDEAEEDDESDDSSQDEVDSKEEEEEEDEGEDGETLLGTKFFLKPSDVIIPGGRNDPRGNHPRYVYDEATHRMQKCDS